MIYKCFIHMKDAIINPVAVTWSIKHMQNAKK